MELDTYVSKYRSNQRLDDCVVMYVDVSPYCLCLYANGSLMIPEGTPMHKRGRIAMRFEA